MSFVHSEYSKENPIAYKSSSVCEIVRLVAALRRGTTDRLPAKEVVDAIMEAYPKNKEVSKEDERRLDQLRAYFTSCVDADPKKRPDARSFTNVRFVFSYPPLAACRPAMSYAVELISIWLHFDDAVLFGQYAVWV
jgi:hypothetical protein